MPGQDGELPRWDSPPLSQKEGLWEGNTTVPSDHDTTPLSRLEGHHDELLLLQRQGCSQELRNRVKAKR